MRKKIVSIFTASMLLFSVTFMNTGCFGSFNLTQKVYNFNKGVGNKFVQEIVFILLFFIPVYAVAGAIDAIILNLVEFWTGSNPLAMNDGEIKQQLANIDGKLVQMTATKGKMTIIEQTNGVPSINIEMVYNFETNTWDVYSDNELSHSLAFTNENGDVELIKDGKLVAGFNLNNSSQRLFALAR